MEGLLELAIFLGINQPVNGSWLVAICNYYGITQSVNGSWYQAWANHIGITQTENGSWIIPIAKHYGATTEVNGSWLYALVLAIKNVSPSPTPTPTITPTITPTMTPTPTPSPVPQVEIVLEHTAISTSNSNYFYFDGIVGSPGNYAFVVSYKKSSNDSVQNNFNWSGMRVNGLNMNAISATNVFNSSDLRPMGLGLGQRVLPAGTTSLQIEVTLSRFADYCQVDVYKILNATDPLPYFTSSSGQFYSPANLSIFNDPPPFPPGPAAPIPGNSAGLVGFVGSWAGYSDSNVVYFGATEQSKQYNSTTGLVASSATYQLPTDVDIKEVYVTGSPSDWNNLAAIMHYLWH